MPSIEIAGDDLLSVATVDTTSAQGIAIQLRESGDWLEVVPGIDSVVVQFDASIVDVADAQLALEQALKAAKGRIDLPDTLVEIPIVYGGEYGPDLEDVCDLLKLSCDEFVALHTAGEYRVDLVGFTPGFVYVGGLDERLSVPRRTKPRQHVPAGSVGIADERTGLYALQSPGGWRLVGRTTHTLFDPESDDPFPLRAGMRVKFVSVDAADGNE